jgi:hypothetical protein
MWTVVAIEMRRLGYLDRKDLADLIAEHPAVDVECCSHDSEDELHLM